MGYSESDATDESCFQFCIGKGLDISALAEGVCRCGATQLNMEIWRMSPPRPGLVYDASHLEHDEEQGSGGTCMRVYRYSDYYESGGIPSHLQNVMEGDLEYTDTIVMGFDVGEGIEEDGIPSPGGPETNSKGSEEGEEKSEGQEKEEEDQSGTVEGERKQK